jgi:hypothetical protein
MEILLSDFAEVYIFMAKSDTMTDLTLDLQTARLQECFVYKAGLHMQNPALGAGSA